jgi:hypothetical protein
MILPDTTPAKPVPERARPTMNNAESCAIADTSEPVSNNAMEAKNTVLIANMLYSSPKIGCVAHAAKKLFVLR